MAQAAYRLERYSAATGWTTYDPDLDGAVYEASCITKTRDGVTTKETFAKGDADLTRLAAGEFAVDLDGDEYTLGTWYNSHWTFVVGGTTINRTMPFYFDESGAVIVAPTIPTLTVADNEDGSGAVATVAGADSGTTNKVYAAPYGTATWTLGATVNENGNGALSLAEGSYWAYCKSEDANDCTSTTAPVHFVVTSGAITTPLYRVTAIHRERGDRTKALVIERYQKPEHP